MKLKKYDPVSDAFLIFNDDFTSWPDRLTDAFFRRPAGTDSPATVMPVDVRELEESYMFRAELPGVLKDDIKIEYKDGLLSISAEKKFDGDTAKEGYHLVERRYGSFRREFVLPRGIDAGKITAGYENGVLTLTVPKPVEARPRHIPINVA